MTLNQLHQVASAFRAHGQAQFAQSGKNADLARNKTIQPKQGAVFRTTQNHRVSHFDWPHKTRQVSPDWPGCVTDKVL
jgi:hypothetical protein